MTDKEIEDKIQEMLSPDFRTKGITGVNHKLHPYVIGAKHVSYAAEHCSGMLGLDVLNKIGCAHPECGMSYDEHTFDRVLFISLTRNLTKSQADAKLIPVSEALIQNSIDGIVFVETPEKFRIA